LLYKLGSDFGINGKLFLRIPVLPQVLESPAHRVESGPTGRCDHAVKVINAVCTAGRPTYSHHYGYSVHVKAAACMPHGTISTAV